MSVPFYTADPHVYIMRRKILSCKHATIVSRALIQAIVVFKTLDLSDTKLNDVTKSSLCAHS